MIEEINVPEERKPVLIGKGGQAKSELENRSGTTITIHDSVTIEGDDPISVMKAAE